jgi:hypothetical protein
MSKIRFAAVVSENKNNLECKIKHTLIFKIRYSVSQLPFISFLKMESKCGATGPVTDSTVCSPFRVSSPGRDYPSKVANKYPSNANVYY